MEQRRFIERFDGNDRTAHLGIAMIEGALVSDFCRPFSVSCYTLEGSSPLIFSAYKELKKIDDIIEHTDRYPLPTVTKVVE